MIITAGPMLRSNIIEKVANITVALLFSPLIPEWLPPKKVIKFGCACRLAAFLTGILSGAIEWELCDQ